MDIPHYRKIDDIAVVTIHNPPDNLLSHAVRRDLLAAIKQAFADRAVHALILIGDGPHFAGGADLKEFGKPSAFPSMTAILDALMVATKPLIAALHGDAFGAGFELALACQWRIATPGAHVAQPEVMLGLMPGGGGTQWWTRLAGPAIALDVCTSGEPMDARAAQACGVIDRLTDEGEDLLAGALAFAHDILDGHVAPRDLRLASEKLAVKPDLFAQFRRAHGAAWQGLVAPWKIVDCIEAACTLAFADGARQERAAFRECEQSPQSRALIHWHFAAQALGEALRTAGVAEVPVAPEAMRQTLVAAHKQLFAQGVALVQQQRVLAAFGFEQERLDDLASQASLYDVVLPALASPMSDHAVLQQLLYALVNGGARLLADGSVRRPGDIDVAAVQALGFPAHHGGPMWWAQVQGLATVTATIARYRGKAGDDWLAPATLMTVIHGAHWRAILAVR